MALNKSDIQKITSLVNNIKAANTTLFVLGFKAAKSVYANANKEGANELAQYMMDNVPVSYRAPLASWFRKQGLVVDAMDAKVTKLRDQYVVGNAPLTAKVQAKVFERLAEAEKVITGNATRTDDFAWDVLPLQQNRAYKEPTKKELSKADVDVQKRAREAVAKVISRMKESDPLGAAALNALWAKKQASEEDMIFIDPTGAVIKLSEDEANYITGYLHSIRK